MVKTFYDCTGLLIYIFVYRFKAEAGSAEEQPAQE